MNHDRGLWWCLGQILGTDLEQCEAGMRDVATLPLVLGCLGISAQASQLSGPVGRMLFRWCARATQKLLQLVRHLEGNPDPPSLAAAEHAARALSGILGFEPPSWRSLLFGARPAARAPDTFEPGTQRQGWQHQASSRTEGSGMCCSQLA